MKVLRDKDVNNVKWYVVGYGPDEAMLQELIKENKLEDRFFLLGKKINPYPYMKKCDIYIQPSRYEGKSVTVLEAQMLGKPVLITNYPTAKSQLKHNIDGYITDLSVDGIVKGIEKLINDVKLRSKLEENTKEFDYSNVEELEKLYEIIGE
jgi:glycosyltransferase involved in cell wall biosynthesis